MSKVLEIVGGTHAKVVHGRRVERLARALLPLLDEDWRVVDVGCGDGRLGARIARDRPDLELSGLDVLARGDTAIPVEPFDGERLPLAPDSVDAVLLIDVLHHTADPRVLLGEAKRVARRAVLIKDHRLARPLAGPTLRLMDWVGNRPHGVALPYNYWPEERWREAWRKLGLRVEHFQTDLGLYPWAARWLFESGLHFLAKLAPQPTP